METMMHLTTKELEAGLEHILQSPKDNGVLELIVRRPQVDEREILQEGQLNLREGLVGDSWRARCISRQPNREPDPEVQLTLMNSRVTALVAQEKERWPLAGDQLYVDLDISAENLPPGTRLAVGGAVVEVTAVPHTGCKKFKSRFGMDALNFVNSTEGKQLHLRGINAKVVQPGAIRLGDGIRKV